MRPETSRAIFEAFVKADGGDIATTAPSEGIRWMLEFYRQIRAEEVAGLDHNGDTLLFEWGTFDWGKGSRFEISISRQFIDASATGDDAISQLRLIYYFAPNPELSEIKNGERWCDQPKWLSDLELFIRKNGAYQTIAMYPPQNVELIYTRV